jgi:hypothetical protein
MREDLLFHGTMVQDSKADITPVQLSDAHNQYQFLSGEAMQKIMVSHRVVSPMLLGIKDNSGFGNNAEEMKTASILFDNVVVRPFQRLIIDAVTQVLNFNGYNLNLYFKTLQPLEFTDLSGNIIDDETREEETGVSLSSEKKKIELVKPNAGESKDDFLGRCIPIVVREGKDTDQATAICYSYFEGKDMTIADENLWLEHLKDKGEVNNDEEWELVDVREVTDADEELKFNLAYENPNKKSDDDKGVYKIRYRYGPNFVSNNSRQFCTAMVQESKGGVIYRREDIIAMGDAGVNGQFAPQGESTYSIWKYKGGVNCHHRWERLTFRRKQIKGKFLPKQPGETGDNRNLENYNEVSNKSADKAGVPFSPSGWDTAKTRPIDMPNKGSLKNK